MLSCKLLPTAAAFVIYMIVLGYKNSGGLNVTIMSKVVVYSPAERAKKQFPSLTLTQIHSDIPTLRGWIG
jgi:hypothetical protein